MATETHAYPKAFEDYGDLTVVLLLNGKEKPYNFCEFVVDVLHTDDMEQAKGLGLSGPAHGDGFIYYLHAEPMDYGVRHRIVQLSYEEVTLLKRQLNECKKRCMDN